MTKYIVSTGHTSTGITLHNGDTLSTFGTVTSTTVSGGGADYVFDGGTASFTTVLLAGDEYVSSGGTAIGTTVSNGGTQRVYSSGTTSFTTLSNGGIDYVSRGGIASLTTVSSGGFEVVSGGTVVSTTVDSSGTEDVIVGGTASFTTVSFGGTLEVRSGSTAYFATLSGGTGNVSAHGTAISTSVDRQGTEIVSTGGVASFTTVDDGGYQEVSGGTAIDATVDGGFQTLSLGGTATSTTISAGGFETVSTGGKTSFTTVDSGGAEQVGHGGAAISTTISDGGSAYVYSSGETSLTTVSSGGVENVAIFGIASFTTLDSGGTGYVSSGGTAISTTVRSGGTEYALLSGTTDFTSVASGATEFVNSLGSAVSTTVDSGGYEVVFDGGTAIFATVSGGGTLVVLPGGQQIGTIGGGHIVSTGVVVYAPATGISVFGAVANDVAVSSGGTEFILPGGTARFAAVSSGGTDDVYSGGVAISATLSGGTEFVFSSGTTSFTTVSSGGEQDVESGGLTVSTLVDFEGVETVSSGGTARDTTLVDGGVLHVARSGTAVSTTVQDAFLGVSAGGAVSFTSVTGDGQDLVSSGGLAVSTTVANGAEETVVGVTSFTTVDSGSFQNLFDGGTTVSTTVAPGGTQLVDANGTAENTTVDSGGLEFVAFGGRTSFTTVSKGGVEFVFSGGLAASTTVSTGGSLVVLPGGLANGTVFSGGAVVSTGVVVYQPGAGVIIYPQIANGVAVSSGGTEYVLMGGSAVSTTVGLAGGVEIYDGGTTTGTQVHDGGMETVSGGTASFTTVSGGGTDDVDAGGSTIGATLSGGFQLLSAAFASDTTVDSGGTQLMIRDATAVSTTVNDGGFQTVSGGEFYFSMFSAFFPVAGGTTSDTVVNSGGTEQVEELSTAVSTTVNDGGSMTIDGNATGSFTTVNSGGVETVEGGSAFSTTVNSGGVENVEGGVAVSTTVDSGGTQFVSDGGVTSFTTVSKGDAEIVLNEGAAVSTTVSTGGYLVVLPHGAQTGTVLSGGEIVSSGVVLYRPGAGVTVFDSTTMGVSVGSGATAWILSSGATVSTAVHHGGSEFVYSGGTASFTTVDSGGIETVSSGGAAVGTTLNDGGFEVVSAGGVASFTTVSSGGEEVMYAGFATSTMVNLGGSIDFTTLGYDAGGTAFVDANDVLSVTIDGVTDTQQLAGSYSASENFVLAAGATYGGTQATLEGTPCYCRGTLILTDGGEVAVEDLHIGDCVVTLSGTARPIRWIGRRSYAGRFAAGNRNVLPILIRRDALSPGTPRRDLLVSPLHAMFLDDVLIPAAALVNGVSIVQLEAVERVEYFHIELDTHDVILAEGAPAETFADDDSRGMFHNAAEYRLLYPNAPRGLVRFCAPRVEDGAALEAVRLRLAARAGTDAAAIGTLRGHLDQVGHGRITGWARDMAAPDRKVRLRILDNDVTIAEVVADSFRADLLRQGMGDGRHGFDVGIDGGLSPFLRHVIRVQCAADGQDLPASPRILAAAPLALPAPARGAARLCGNLDVATRERIAGWAQDAADAGTPVALQILDNGLPIARVLANRGRTDLADAGIGSGRHGFDLIIPGGLSPLSRHIIQVRCEADGAELPGSPAVIEAADAFDASLRQTIANAVAAIGSQQDRNNVLSFILQQADRLAQQHADVAARCTDRLVQRQRRRRAGPLTSAGPADMPAGMPTDITESATPLCRRALVIDERLPATERDAGSQAILSHMRALRRLGYEVSFIPADEMAPDDADVAPLAATGVTCCVAPFYAAVEDVLRRQADCFDLVYLHRVGIATRYLGLARRYMKRARIVYSVADLHHVRLERQATVEARPDLLAMSRRARLEECVAAWSADAVITHAAGEADILRRLVPEASVYRVPWQVPERATATSFATRGGLAFVGNYAHAPNVDAACWLVDAVMPLVWRTDPDIECKLVGSDMPAAVRRLAGSRVLALGHVAELAEVFGRVRLTVAPLRYGAGVKGKVLDSFAAGIPCVMSPTAAEGLELSKSLLALVGEDAAALAALICRLHRDVDANRAAARAGRTLVRANHAEADVTQALRAAIEGRGPPAQSAASRTRGAAA